MKAIKFTKTNLDKLEHGSKRERIFSSDCPSLCVVVQPVPSLNKSFYAHWSVVRFAKDGKQKRQGRYKLICRYGSKPIEEVKKIVINNIDNWRLEKSQTSKIVTVGDLAKAFIKDGATGFRVKGKKKIKYKTKTVKDYKNRLKLYVLMHTKKLELISMLSDPFRYAGDTYSTGALRDIPLKDIKKRDIELWHARMESIPTAVNRALAVLSVAIEWDMKRTTSRLFHQEVNPCLRVDKYPEEPDKNYIDTIEKVLEIRNYCLAELWRDPHFLTFYLLNLECGERLEDLYGITWTEPLKSTDKDKCTGWVSLRTGQLFLKDTKNRKSATIDLTEEAIQGLQKLQNLKVEQDTAASFAANSIWIFPRPSDATKHINENSYRKKLWKFHYKFGLATRELVRGKGKRKLYKYTNILSFKHIRKTFVTYYGREHGEEAASHRMRHSTIEVTRNHYFNADKKKLKVKHMYSTGENVVQLKKAGNDEQ